MPAPISIRRSSVLQRSAKDHSFQPAATAIRRDGRSAPPTFDQPTETKSPPRVQRSRLVAAMRSPSGGITPAKYYFAGTRMAGAKEFERAQDRRSHSRFSGRRARRGRIGEHNVDAGFQRSLVG